MLGHRCSEQTNKLSSKIKVTVKCNNSLDVDSIFNFLLHLRREQDVQLKQALSIHYFLWPEEANTCMINQIYLN